MVSNLLATKLYLPAPPPKRVQRPHLIQSLDEGLEAGRKVTLISAPAGFGKTTCVSEWVANLKMPVSWLSLDPGDDDPGRFFTYFVAALQKVDSNLGRELEGVLLSGQLPPGEMISTTLINDIHRVEHRFLLVLDDFHVIQDSFILQVLEKLVSSLPPTLHLVLLTREDPSLPLARLRANNQLTEIRAGDLRFTPAEAAQFLNEAMGLCLSQEDITTLEDRTEGWIVGLQLAGLSVRDRPNPSPFISALSGSHRYILSYLTEEVLSRQPDEIHQFLLRTSILERLCGPLCDAVLKDEGSSFSSSFILLPSSLILNRLESSNLFLIPLDDEQRWYRYHHLFADLLRARLRTLPVGTTPELHRRASRWYAQAGMVNEAMQHALAAKDYATAVDLIESHAVDLLVQWHVKTVEGWLQAIPPEWRSQRPRLNLAFAWMHLSRGSFPQAMPYIERLYGMFAGSTTGKDDPSLMAEWLALQAILLNAQGKPAESLTLARQALEIVPEADAYVRSDIYMGLAAAYQQMGDYPNAMDAFQKIIQHGRAGGNLSTELLGIAGLTQMALFHGQYHLAFEYASQGTERVERSGSLPLVSTAVYGVLGQIYYEWHQLEQAHHHFQRSIQLSRLSGFSDAEIYHGVILSRLHHIEGDLDAAAQEVQKAVGLMHVQAPAAVREEVISQQVRIDLAQGRLAAAETALMLQPADREGLSFSTESKFSIPDLVPDEQLTHPLGRLYISALRILLHRARVKGELPDLRRGIDLAGNLIDGALHRQFIQIALETLLVRAQMHAEFGNEPASLEDTLKALELGEPEGFISVFVAEGQPVSDALAALLERSKLGSVQPDYVRSILAAFPGAHRAVAGKNEPPASQSLERIPSGPPVLLEPLTDRELDVLRLMAEGLKYEEITERLYISLNTVRTHVKAIYGKLGVNNRTKAIEKAEQLEIL